MKQASHDSIPKPAVPGSAPDLAGEASTQEPPSGMDEITGDIVWCQPERLLPSGLDYSQPLASLCWRVLKRERTRFVMETSEDVIKLEQGLGRMALDVHALGECLSSMASEVAGDRGDLKLKKAEVIQRHMVRLLEQCGVRTLAPVGQPYTGDLTEMFDSAVQRPEAGLVEPRLAEVITPAVLRGDTLVCQGRAVIAVPVQKEEEGLPVLNKATSEERAGAPVGDNGDR